MDTVSPLLLDSQDVSDLQDALGTAVDDRDNYISSGHAENDYRDDEESFEMLKDQCDRWDSLIGVLDRLFTKHPDSETGSASLHVFLRDGKLIVRHGTGRDLLLEGRLPVGGWSQLCSLMVALVDGPTGLMAEKREQRHG